MTPTNRHYLYERGHHNGAERDSGEGREDGAWWVDDRGDLLRRVLFWEDFPVDTVLEGDRVVSAETAAVLVGLRRRKPIGGTR